MFLFSLISCELYHHLFPFYSSIEYHTREISELLDASLASSCVKFHTVLSVLMVGIHFSPINFHSCRPYIELLFQNCLTGGLSVCYRSVDYMLLVVLSVGGGQVSPKYGIKTT